MDTQFSLASIAALVALVILLSAAIRDRLWLRYLFFLRVPLFGLLILLLFPLLAPRIRTLASLLVMQWDGFLALTYFVFLAAWTCGFTAEITWRLAPARFDVNPPRLPAWLAALSDGLDRRLPGWMRSHRDSWSEPRFLATRHLPFSSLAALPLLIATLLASRRVFSQLSFGTFLMRYLGAALAGFAAAVATLAIILAVRALIGRRGESGAGAMARIFGRLPGLRSGYVYTTEGGRSRFTSGHAMGAALATIAVLTYLGVIFLSRPTNSVEDQLVALHYLLIFLTLFVLTLSGATYFFDRFRVSSLGILLLVVLGLGGIGGVDYRFDLWKPEQDGEIAARRQRVDAGGKGERSFAMRPAAPAEALEAVPEKLRAATGRDRPTLVVVTAAGGGIQAAAWTARVLTGLGEEIGPVFGESVGLISSVSGGSVGTMYWVEAFCDGRPPGPQSSDAIFRAASHPSLQATVWALLFNDLPRLVWPFGSPGRDRAWAMERSWEGALQTMVHETCPETTGPAERPARRLSEWTTETRAGLRPAVIMNSFATSSGRRLLLGSSSVPVLVPSFLDFQQYCCAGQEPADIDIVTAARISATFPWVTPQARPQWVDRQDRDPYALPNERLADGGYYDNFGIITAGEWLQAAVSPSDQRFGHVALVQIDPFPAIESADEDSSGLVAETLGPLQALLRGRTSTQRDRADQMLDRLRQHLNRIDPDFFATYLFKPPTLERNTNVLSWHLSPAEKESLLEAWDELVASSADLERLQARF